MRTRLDPLSALLALCCCAVVASLPAVARKEPLPYDLWVEVSFEEQGPEVVREELEIELFRSLDSHGCFPVVEPFDGSNERREGELLFRLSVEHVVDETSFDVSIAQRDAPDAPPGTEKLLTSWIEIDVRLELYAFPDGVPVRTKWFRVRIGYRPVADEDPRLESQTQAIDAIVRRARAWACDGSAKKLKKEIDKARALAAASG